MTKRLLAPALLVALLATLLTAQDGIFRQRPQIEPSTQPAPAADSTAENSDQPDLNAGPQPQWIWGNGSPGGDGA